MKWIEVRKKDGRFVDFTVYDTNKVGHNLTKDKEIKISYNENMLPVVKKQYRIKTIKTVEL